MLIVIVIIGILAAALIPRLTGIQSRARDTARAYDLRNIGQGVRMYQLDFGSFPTSTGTTGGNWVASTGLDSKLVGYMDKIPADGLAYMPYQYAVNNSQSIFALAAVVEGGTKAANWTGTSNDIKAQPNPITTLSGASQVSEVVLRTEAQMNSAASAKNSWRTVQLNG